MTDRMRKKIKIALISGMFGLLFVALWMGLMSLLALNTDRPWALYQGLLNVAVIILLFVFLHL